MGVFMMRTSERRSMKRCEFQWKWGYLDRLHPLQESNPLWFGQAMHIALAEYYLPGKERGPHPAENFVKVLDEGRVKYPEPSNEESADELADAYAMGVDMLNRYVDTFGLDSDWECIQPEMTFRVWIPHPTNKELKKWFLYVGTIDGVFRYVGPQVGTLVPGSIWLFEHKSAKSIQVHHLPLDDQAGSYWAFAGIILRRRGILKEDEQISGIMYNFLRKTEDDKRPMNADGLYCNKPVKQDYLEQLTAWAKENKSGIPLTAKMTIAELETTAKTVGLTVYGEPSKVQPAPYFERIPVFRSKAERQTMLQRVQAEGLRKEALSAERPLLPLIKNPTKDCEWDCSFRRMCEMHEAGADWEEYRDVSFKQWNPYGDHEIMKAM